MVEKYHSSSSLEVTADVQCSICLDIFTDPRVLPCLHSFCKSCITRTCIVSPDGKLKCPQCRAVHEQPSNGIEGFVSDTSLSNASRKEREKQKTNQCGMCTSVSTELTAFCINCDLHLCTKCDHYHKKMTVFRSHTTVPSHKAPRHSISYKCSDHPNEELKVYCVMCEIMICRDCIFDHQGHTFKPAESVADEIKVGIITARLKTVTKLDEFREHENTVSRYENYVNKFPRKLKDHIAHEFDEYMQHLNSRKQVLLQQVDTMFETYSKQVLAEKNEVEIVICGLEASKKFADRILQSDSKVELAVLGSKAIPRMQSMCKSTWNSSSISSMYPVAFIPTVVTTVTDDAEGYINALGSLHSYSASSCSKPTLTIKKRGYATAQGASLLNSSSGIASSSKLYDVDISVTTNIDGSFPSHTVEATVECNSKKINSQLIKVKRSNWKLSFATHSIGTYKITVELKVENVTICKETLSLVCNTSLQK